MGVCSTLSKQNKSKTNVILDKSSYKTIEIMHQVESNKYSTKTHNKKRVIITNNKYKNITYYLIIDSSGMNSINLSNYILSIIEVALDKILKTLINLGNIQENEKLIETEFKMLFKNIDISLKSSLFFKDKSFQYTSSIQLLFIIKGILIVVNLGDIQTILVSYEQIFHLLLLTT